MIYCKSTTGKAVEGCFQRHYFKKIKPIDRRIDCRDWVVDYDFRIKNADKKFFIELKGLSEILGGVLCYKQRMGSCTK
jgi:hypothetical protein